MARDLPSLTALQAFEAAMRHESFTRAAAELHRTQGAISRQVAALEEQLGLTLFRREHPRIVPTAAARVFGAKVRAILDRLAAVVLEAQVSRGEGGFLNLAILPTFGTQWLIPRIASFHTAHPGVSVHFKTRLHPFDFEGDFEGEEFDAAIHHGEGRWEGAHLEHLFDEDVVVVCSPQWMEEHILATPADLAGRTLLQLDSRLGGWSTWFQAMEVANVDGRRGPRFEHHLMVIQAAIAGLGVALLPSFLVQKELHEGTLVTPFPDHVLETDKSYWLAYPERSRQLPALQSFRDWLRDRLRAEALVSAAKEQADVPAASG